jgi:hypothetical protein
VYVLSDRIDNYCNLAITNRCSSVNWTAGESAFDSLRERRFLFTTGLRLNQPGMFPPVVKLTTHIVLGM